MKQTRNVLGSLVVCAALIGGGVVGCVPQEDPPELPPVGTMQSDLTTVESAPAAAKNANPEAVGDYSNFANAWVRVNVLRAWAVGIVAIPAAAMGLALTQEPHRQGNAWLWSVNVLGVTGDLELTGGPIAGYDTDFFVTNPSQGIDRFLWVEGHFDASLTSGYWLGHDVNLPASDDEVLEISWSYTSETDRTLAYSNVMSTSPDVGDVVSYTVDGTTATVTFDDASQPEQIATATWSTVTGAGSIQVPGYNGGDKACWNESFVNAACP